MSTSAKFWAVRLQFESSVTFSSGKPDYARGQDHLYSDTIKSAMASAIVKLKGAADLMQFWDAFFVSSAFPIVGDEHFLPIPLKGFQIQFAGQAAKAVTAEEKAASVKSRKKTARLRYLSKSLFEQGLQGKPIRLQEDQLSGDGSLASETTWPTKADERPEFSRATTQRVNVNAGSDDALAGNAYDPEPFFLEQHFPSAKTGWYFLVQLKDAQDTATLDLIKAALRLLEDEGLGTAKSRGMGHFTSSLQAWTLEIPKADTASHCLNLSLYCPENDELSSAFGEDGAWALLKRGGHIAVTEQHDAMRLRKKSIFMLSEGSVFPYAANLQGKWVDLRPQNSALWEAHAILREGRPIFLPFVAHQPST
jgi:CRISPR-associated protein Csm4